MKTENAMKVAVCITAALLSFSTLAEEVMSGDQNKQSHQPHKIQSEQGGLARLPKDLEILFPLSPEERRQVREHQLQEQNATYEPLRDVEPLRDMQRISGQGDIFPIVYVTPDYPSSIVFTDMTGQPWPITYIGQTNSLATVEQPVGSQNSLVLQAQNGAGRKSIAVFLEGLTLPVTVTIDGENNKYHALKHIQITDRGPNAAQTTLTAQSSSRPGRPGKSTSAETTTGRSMDEVLDNLAYNVTPKGFKKLKVSDHSVDAWIDSEDPTSIYVKTEYVVVSPSPRSGSRSVTPLQDNVRIYVLPRINPVMALNELGEKIYLRFKES